MLKVCLSDVLVLPAVGKSVFVLVDFALYCSRFRCSIVEIVLFCCCSVYGGTLLVERSAILLRLLPICYSSMLEVLGIALRRTFDELFIEVVTLPDCSY
jgi:hypothetical protein